MHGRLTHCAFRCVLSTHRRHSWHLSVKPTAAAPQPVRAVTSMAADLQAARDRYFCVRPAPPLLFQGTKLAAICCFTVRKRCRPLDRLLVAGARHTLTSDRAHRCAAPLCTASQPDERHSSGNEPAEGQLRAGRQLMSVAPMMDWTDVYFRQLVRLLSKHTWLYTEMVVVSKASCRTLS